MRQRPLVCARGSHDRRSKNAAHAPLLPLATLRNAETCYWMTYDWHIVRRTIKESMSVSDPSSLDHRIIGGSKVDHEPFERPMIHQARLFLANHSFPRFCLVGGIGFLVDAGVMSILHYRYGQDVLLARLCSFTGAATVTWLLNRKITFACSASLRPVEEWSRYVAVGAFGAAINFAIFLALVRWGPGAARLPLLALTIASSIALLFTYTGSRLFVFSEPHEFDEADTK